MSDVVGAGLQLVGLRGAMTEWLSGASTALGSASRFAGLARAAVRISGVLSAVTGAFTAFQQGSIAYQDWRQDHHLSREGWYAAADAAAGALAAAGGIMLLTPAAPASAVLFAISGLLSAGVWVARELPRLREGLAAYQGIAANARLIVNTMADRAGNALRAGVSNAGQSVVGFIGRLFGS